MNSLNKLATALLTAIFCLTLSAVPTFAQQITATLTGNITDPNGAVVTGATVTATSNETGLSKSDQTNESGRYTITFLQPGSYNITVEAQGFAKASLENVKLEVGQTASGDFQLSVSGGQVDVTVDSNETPLLQTETSALNTTIENKLIEDLPSGERSVLSFINLVPGAIDGGFAQGRGENLNENGNAQGPIGSPGNRNFFDSNFSVNGGRSATNDVLLDGVSNTVGDFNGIAISPPQDSVREFKVVAGSYPAEYGRSGGGVVSIVTKSGGKDYRGALYEYFQDGDLNANGWQRNRRGNLPNGNAVLPRIDLRRHQFGGAFSGPVQFFNFGEGGGLFNKLEKTFFFYNYEGRRENNPFSREITVPTERMRRGDFGELLRGARSGVTNADGTPALFGQIYDPYPTLVNSRRPYFQNNNLSNLPRCPSGIRQFACLDPVALEVLKFIPLPNQPGLVNNYVFSDTALFNRDIHAFRLDHTFSERHSAFGRFSWERRFTSEPNYFNTPAANVRKVKDTFVNFTFNDTFNLTSTLINNFRYGYTRGRAKQIPESLGFDPTTLGFPNYLRERAAELKFPDFTIGGGGIGTTLAGEITGGQIGGAGNNQPRDTHSVGNALTLVTGNHTLRFGGEYRLYRFYPFQFFFPTGNFSFNRTFTSGPIPSAAQSPADTSGSSFASFLLGLPSGGSHEAVAPATIFHDYWAAFVQDDWKIARRLTLNLGLRWDYETGTEETNGLITNFDLNAAAPVQANSAVTVDPQVLALNPNIRNLKGLLSFVDGAQTKTPKNRFAPRVGFAFSINDKTTLRGGYGLFYVPLSLEGTTIQGTNFSTTLRQSVQTNQVVSSGTGQWTTYLSDPFPTNPNPSVFNPLQVPPGTSQGSRTRLGQQVFAVEPERENAYTQQWNLVVQRQLAKNLVLDVGYVGGRGVRLPIQTAELNQLSPQVLAFARNNFSQAACGAAACTSAAQFLTQSVPNPLFGVVPGQAQNIPRRDLLRPFPQYTSVQLFRPHWGESNYHALQVNLQKRFSDGLSATVNYTWSKSLDTGGVGNGAAFLDSTAIQDIYSFRNELSYSTFDVPHRFVASWSYDLPIGKGKWLGKNFNGFLNALLGGWQTSGSYTWQTGTPIPIVDGGFSVGGIGNAVFRPNRLEGDADVGLEQARENARNGGVWFDTTRFVISPDLTFGSAARTYNDVRRDNFRNANLSILKNFLWAEGKQKLQFRAEFLNAFNWVVFGTPVSNRSAGAPNANLTGFGQIRTQGNTPRNIQLVARYTF
jgi:outer membrane receptor protein involved in Fe transport